MVPRVCDFLAMGSTFGMGVVCGPIDHRLASECVSMVSFNNNASRQKFPLGRIVGTPAALEAMGKSGDSPHALLMRHATGDWGDLCAADKQANDDALRHAARILSAYHLTDGTKVWIITEWDRSVTTLLLPSDY